LTTTPENQKNKLSLFQSSLTYRDKRIEGYDAVCLTEVVEHIDPNRLAAFERVVFEFAAPKTVILTTPNAEYNVNYERLNADKYQHKDHRFEWTRAQFGAWAKAVCAQFGYTVAFSDIGEISEAIGSSTQMGVFTKCE
jgi:3' terminal RNA ribose 2'-O-methyltransferase Hen1